MSTKRCPYCGQSNEAHELTCTHCGAAVNTRYVDCYVCGGTGTVVIDYTDKYEALAGGDPVLPCAKCDGTGRLPRAHVDFEKMKAAFWQILDLFA